LLQESYKCKKPMCHLMCPQITQKCLKVKLLFNLLLHSTANRILQQKPTHTLNPKNKIRKQRRSKLAHWQPQRMLQVFTSSNNISFSLNLWKNSKCLTHSDIKKGAEYFHTQEPGECSWTHTTKKGSFWPRNDLILTLTSNTMSNNHLQESFQSQSRLPCTCAKGCYKTPNLPSQTICKFFPLFLLIFGFFFF
jgi:hypothetical protein